LGLGDKNMSLNKSGVGSLDKQKLTVFVPYNSKIADITEADTNKHYLTLANSAGTGAIAGETRKIIAVLLDDVRNSGTGFLKVYPNEGVANIALRNYLDCIDDVVIADGTQRLQYAQSVANDDFDLYCLGYVVEA